MKIDIEEIRKALNEVIAEFGSFNHETGELLPSQSEAVCLAIRAEEKLPISLKPTAQAWNGEGLPPVGCECEVYPYFEKCFICCDYDGGVIIHNLHDDGFFHARNDGKYQFRPIRTPEQIQRDELACLIGETVSMRKTFGEMADALIAAGYHK